MKTIDVDGEEPKKESRTLASLLSSSFKNAILSRVGSPKKQVPVAEPEIPAPEELNNTNIENSIDKMIPEESPKKKRSKSPGKKKGKGKKIKSALKSPSSPKKMPSAVKF
jgi:hypothetical protein